MIRTNFPRFVLMLSFNLALVVGYSQTSREAVILINNNPVRAEIATDGSVTRIIENLGTVDLRGFSLKESDYVSYLKNIAPTESTKPTVKSAESISEVFLVDVFFEAKSEILSDKAIASLETVVAQMRDNPNESIILKTLQNNDKGTRHRARINNIKSYLGLRGIAETKIIFEPSVAGKDANEVKIFLKKQGSFF